MAESVEGSSMTTVDATAAFRRAGYGLFGIASINLLGGMLVLTLGEGHQVGLVGSLAFLRALIKLAPAVYVWRGSRAGAIAGIAVLGLDAAFDLLQLMSGGIDAVLRLALAAVVISWLYRALRARPSSVGVASGRDDSRAGGG
jgi:hypothetical protein